MNEDLMNELKRATKSEESLKEKLEIAELALKHIFNLSDRAASEIAGRALEEIKNIGD